MDWLANISWNRGSLRQFVYGIVLGISLTYTTTSLISSLRRRRAHDRISKFSPRPIELRTDDVVNGVVGLIGNTPLIRINSLSDALGVEILGKAEFLNPGGSVKDRVALRVIDDAERQGLLHPNSGSRIFEGTVGSTGISLTTVARARYAAIIIPDDVAEDKARALQALGAHIEKVRPASIVDKKQASKLNLARQRALEFGESDILRSMNASSTGETADDASTVLSTLVVRSSVSNREVLGMDSSPDDELKTKARGFFADQFENKSNYDAHYEGTGPEIWRQTNGRIAAFVSGAGTGGTLSGVGCFLKSMDENVIVTLADPEGSGLYNKIKFGIMYDEREKEGTKRRHQVDTVVEGIGINRLTRNFEFALPIVDEAFRISDAEAVSMSRHLVQKDGLFLGSSSACNLFACVKLAKEKGWRSGERIVTILCDSGSRHYSKFWNDDYLQGAGIPVDSTIVEAALKNGAGDDH
ncbi:PALP-domain-containing protein [Schizopora paradoxa]|uniref:cysteine synthase n=1 Tax=Schizopora paradoxa TaxID=27342 RepID=A0A0H2S465_9AGAM|nr:PALP-domain-containing protein [Schizopora paradoxa]